MPSVTVPILALGMPKMNESERPLSFLQGYSDSRRTPPPAHDLKRLIRAMGARYTNEHGIERVLELRLVRIGKTIFTELHLVRHEVAI